MEVEIERRVSIPSAEKQDNTCVAQPWNLIPATNIHSSCDINREDFLFDPFGHPTIDSCNPPNET